MDAERLLADLDQHQRAAVTTDSTLVAVIAAAGSGKTRVLTRRIAHRVATATADAHHTLCVTFTREAAGELRRRLRRSGLRDPVEAGTFHSIALGLLRQRWFDTGRPPPTVLDDPERLLAHAAAGVPVAVLAAEHDWAAARGIAAADYVAAARAAHRRGAVPAEAIGAALVRYGLEKRRRGVVDLGELLTTLADEIEADEGFAAGVRWRFRHVLVDEAQDLNPAQYRMLRGIVGDRLDLFLVGDPDQAVYGFNGSDPALLSEVDRHLPGIEVVRLPTNHRCTPQIVTAGQHALAAAGSPPAARSGREPGRPVEMVVAADEHDEAQRVAATLRAMATPLLHGGRVAVLARTHEQLAGLRRACEQAGVALAHNPTAAGSPLAVAVRTAGRLPSATRLRAWAHDVLDQPPPVPAGEGGSAPAPGDPERRVAGAVLDFLRDAPFGDGAAFRSWVASVNPFAEPGDRAGVALLTFHAAKGREWHTVIVTGAETGLVPHRSATTVEARAEEARLLHVAFTRAADRLIVTRAERRRGYARRPSPFLAGLAETLEREAGAAPAVPAPPALHAVAAAGERDRQRIASLTAWRAAAARASALLPHQICTDDEISAIAAAAPTTPAELSAVTSFGPVSASRHFAPIRAALDAVG